MALLELEGVSVVRDGRPILSELSFRVEEGGHTAILGPNGSGKTTLLRLLQREIYPFAGRGRVRILGRSDWEQRELRRLISVVSADPGASLLDDFTVREMALSGRLGTYGVTWGYEVTSADEARAASALEQVGMAGFEDRRFTTLSTGEQRRTLIARALAGDPRLLVLDEPTAGLDLKAQREVLATFDRLAETGCTLLLVTHDLSEIHAEFQRIVALRNGSVRFDLPRSQVLPVVLADLFEVPEDWIPAFG